MGWFQRKPKINKTKEKVLCLLNGYVDKWNPRFGMFDNCKELSLNCLAKLKVAKGLIESKSNEYFDELIAQKKGVEELVQKLQDSIIAIEKEYNSLSGDVYIVKEVENVLNYAYEICTIKKNLKVISVNDAIKDNENLKKQSQLLACRVLVDFSNLENLVEIANLPECNLFYKIDDKLIEYTNVLDVLTQCYLLNKTVVSFYWIKIDNELKVPYGFSADFNGKKYATNGYVKLGLSLTEVCQSGNDLVGWLKVNKIGYNWELLFDSYFDNDFIGLGIYLRNEFIPIIKEYCVNSNMKIDKSKLIEKCSNRPICSKWIIVVKDVVINITEKE